MGNALFYHLTRSNAETLVPQLLGKSLAAGWRVDLRGANAPRMEALDAGLWQSEGFLPHGMAGGPHDAHQPVILRAADAPPAANAPECLMALDGTEVTPAEALALQGRAAEAEALRLDTAGVARYGFGADSVVRARMRDISALVPAMARLTGRG